jgi:hypothetical protein
MTGPNEAANEAAEADVQEQRQSLQDEAPPPTGELPEDAPEADALDQRLEVELDEEDAPIG